MSIEEKAAKTKIREVPLLVFSNQIIEWCSMITSRAFSFHRASLVLRFAIGPLFLGTWVNLPGFAWPDE